jgi:hypothetical protein
MDQTQPSEVYKVKAVFYYGELMRLGEAECPIN